MRMRQERDGKGMWQREVIEAVDTVELHGEAVMTPEQANGGGNVQEQGHEYEQPYDVEESELEEQGAALAVLLGQMVAYLSSKVDVNDLDIVSFSLHHLFCGFDSLYRVLLPSFVVSLASEAGEETDAHSGQIHPMTWLQLQSLRQVIHRMLPLCQLLSEAAMRILGQLGYGRESSENEGSEESQENKWSRTERATSLHETHGDEGIAHADKHRAEEWTESEQDILYMAASTGIEQALRDLAASLMCWQQQYHGLPSFRSQLFALFPTMPLPLQPDAPFMQLLEYASALFGDIVPAFQALSPGDDEAVILLLFDLLQQIDLLALECETLLELFTLLLKHLMVAAI